MKNIHLVYYSPALSTRKIIRMMGKSMQLPSKEYDITEDTSTPPAFRADDLVVFAVPVFAGRVPALASKALSKIKGENTPAIIICVYGNREYEDALLELRNICTENGFIPFAGGAFVARHSIFPNVAINRPDDQDQIEITQFAKKCIEEYEKLKLQDENKHIQLNVKGNYPYRDPSVVPLKPTGDSKCDKCGTCVKRCPVNAISEKNPRKTDKDLCISCARCVAVCPQHSRKFRGIIYQVARKKFESAYGNNRKEVETFFL
ncbi:4Fe-4S binding protein [Dysgonomonas sp. OttesenSCG-928-M03]|nr:4Fe-4S binding protein [Dysgonomonas sp. OttesenSCG-928-M03]